MVSLVFDLIALTLIITMVIISAKKGFLSGFVSCVGWIVSAFVAKTLCTVISNYIYINFLKDRLYTAVLTAIESHAVSLSSSYSTFFSSLPNSLQILLGSVDGETLDTIFSDPLRTTETVSTKITEEIVAPIFMTMLLALTFIIVFLLCMLVVSLLAGLFKGVRKIPVIGPINTFLGCFIGLAKSVILLYIIKIVIEFVTTAAGGNLFGLSLEDFSNSYVFQFFNFNFRGLL